MAAACKEYTFFHFCQLWAINWYTCTKQEQWGHTQTREHPRLKNLHTCFKNSSKAISPCATMMISLTMLSFFWRSMSQMCPRVSSDRTQLTRRRFISDFQWRSFSASDFSSVTSMLTYEEELIAYVCVLVTNS